MRLFVSGWKGWENNFGLQKPMVDMVRKSLNRLEKMILGWAEQIGQLYG